MDILIDKEDYDKLEAQGKQNGLTADEQLQLIILKFFKANDPKIYNDTKKHADPHILKAVEKNPW